MVLPLLPETPSLPWCQDQGSLPAIGSLLDLTLYRDHLPRSPLQTRLSTHTRGDSSRPLVVIRAGDRFGCPVVPALETQSRCICSGLPRLSCTWNVIFFFFFLSLWPSHHNTSSDNISFLKNFFRGHLWCLLYLILIRSVLSVLAVCSENAEETSQQEES